MQRIYDCLVMDHNLWMVLLAGTVCFLSALTAINLIGRARDSQRPKIRASWLGTAAVVTGFGIWATHFIAMLAYQPGLPVTYDFWLTVTSVVVAIVVTGMGIAACVYRDGPRWAALGGAIVGLGISAMHYIGMSAVRLAGYFKYDVDLVGLSVVLGVGLGALALLTAHRWRTLGGVAGATGLLTLAICGMHFSGMASLNLVPLADQPLSEFALSDRWLAIGLAIVTAMIAILCLSTSLLDQHLVRRTVDEARRLETLAGASTEGIVICSDEQIEYANAAFLRMTGLSARNIAGLPVRHFLDEQALQATLRLMALNPQQSRAIETALRVNAAQSLPIELFARDMQDGKKHKQIFVIRDLTEQKRSQARIEYLAHHDALTELPNRVQFNDRLQHDLACAARAQSSLAVLCLDMDRFKDVNDSMGHASGDELLKNVARRLAGIVRETDTVARLSGDEFAIVQVGCNQPDSAQRLATRIRDAMAEPFVLEGGATIVGMSIGVAVYPDDGDSAAILLRNADMALYRAKAEGRNTYRFFEPDMDKAMRERRELERDLRSSVENRELYLQYQPLAETQSGLVVGFEALVRWRHPVRGQLPPNDFIGIAEECGFITQLGQWVLREACREAARWTAPLRIAINLSPIQFQHGNLTQDVAAILAETGLAPERLELEITEGVLLADKANAIDTLTALKQLGVRIAMDDFGTGYSSLSYLQSFPFDKIKIDRSFVAGLQGNDDARAIVKAVIGLSHALNLPVVAEGVENDYQLELLRSELCTEVQGYLIGRPSDIDRFAELTGVNRQLWA